MSKTIFKDHFYGGFFGPKFVLVHSYVYSYFIGKSHDLGSLLIVGINLYGIKHGDARNLRKLEYLCDHF